MAHAARLILESAAVLLAVVLVTGLALVSHLACSGRERL